MLQFLQFEPIMIQIAWKVSELWDDENWASYGMMKISDGQMTLTF